MIDFGLYATYVLLGVAVAAAIIFPIINSLSNPRSLMRAGAAIVGILVLFGIGYAMSDSKISNAAIAAGLDESGVKLIGAGLIMFYIVFAIAVLALIYSEISKALK